jgi:acyl-CoA synthetase (AMP-forming)/AMP-acid ligase II
LARWRPTTVTDLLADGAGTSTVDGVCAGPADLAQILYTSGTTGRPKGVAASHANLVNGFVADPRRLALAHSDAFLHAFPVGTNAAQTMLLNALTARPTCLCLPQFTALRFARLIEEARVGTIFLVPTVAIELLNSGALRGRDTNAVQLVGSTAAPLPPAIASRLARAFPQATIVNYYTSTEAAPTQTSMIFDPNRRDAVGRAADGAVLITTETGAAAAPGDAGEVWLRAAHPRSYYRDEAASAATFRGPWVRTGDVGRLDKDGYLYLLDRDVDIVKSGAFKVSTVEIEAALYEHPDIAEVAVVGVPHAQLGSALAAVVVSRGGADRTALTLPALRGFLASRLADHQLPARLVLVDQLPRNEAGKVLKRELVGQLKEAEHDA